jgi:protein O-GlcNAc transferase
MGTSDVLQDAVRKHRSGNFQKAEELYKEILDVQPDNFHALHYLGALYSQLGNYDFAVKYIKSALEVDSSDSHAHYNLGIALQGKGDLDEAASAYRRSLELDALNADALVNLGIIYREKGQIEDAVTCLRHALELNPALAAAYNNLGIILKQKGLADEAIANFRKASHANPGSAGILLNLATVLQEKGLLEDAVISYKKALEISPDSADVLFHMGTAFLEQGKTDEASRIFDRVLQRKPRSFSARLAHCIARIPVIYGSEASLYDSRRNYSGELAALADAMFLDNSHDIEEAAEAIGSIQPFYLAYQNMNDRELQNIYGNIICSVMRLRYPHFAESRPMPPRREGEPIKVGFVSGYFYNHSVWKTLTKGWMENLDKARFELYGYYTWKSRDGETEIAKRHAKHFIENVFSFEDLCSFILRDNLHILIFPEIGMDPVTLKIASLKLAPIQCTSWGHPTTSGLPSVYFYLGSDLMEPPGAEKHYTEELIRLPNLSICYDPPALEQADRDRDYFGLDHDSLIYHCCQSLYKYLPQFDDVFPRIAQEVSSCKFLFCSHPKSEWITNQFKERLGRAFERSGMKADEWVVFLPFLALSEYNSLYSLCDVFLDPIGWSGCNSALEAISCNLPVVAFPGELMRSRDSYAILTMMDVKETIASSVEEYIQIASRLGRDPGWRKYISGKIALNKERVYHDKTCITSLEKFLEKATEEAS